MSNRTRRSVVFGLAACAAGPLATAFGAESDEPVRVELVAPPGCPDVADFAGQIESRTTHLRRASAGEKARLVRAEIASRATGVTGRLVLVETDGQTSERTLEAPDCRQATEALALIASLAIDRRASSEAPLAPTPPPRPAPTPTATASAHPPAPPPTAAPPPPPSRAGGPRDERPPRVSFDGTLGALGTLGMAPGPTAGPALLVGVSSGHPRSVWSWSARVGVVYTIDRSFREPGGTAAFGLLAGIAEVCPLSIHFGARARLQPCVLGEYGRLHVGVSQTAEGRPVDRPWAGAGIGARIAYDVVGPLRVEAAAGGLLALQRDSFEFGTSQFFEVPSVVGRALVGVGAAWP
jgi:hypothetical protein